MRCTTMCVCEKQLNQGESLRSKELALCSYSGDNASTFTALHCTFWLHSKAFANTNVTLHKICTPAVHTTHVSRHTHSHAATGLRTNYTMCHRGDSEQQVPWGVGVGVGFGAGLPVGAQIARRLFMAFHRSTMYLVVVVLPHPGPPVTTQTGERAAVRIASLCPSDSCSVCPAQGMTHLGFCPWANTHSLPQPILALQTCDDSTCHKCPAQFEPKAHVCTEVGSILA